MHLHAYRIRNYRRLRDALVELGNDISIFVGANNSGKTSATQAIQMFLSGSKERFSLFDFSSYTWAAMNQLGDADSSNDTNAEIPSISLDLWIGVAEDDLHLVIPILPSTDWTGTEVGIRIEFAPVNSQALLGKFRQKKLDATTGTAALVGGPGNYIPWPRNLANYLERELHQEYEFKYFVLDRTQFSDSYVPNAGYVPVELAGDQKGGSLLKSLIRIGSLSAQRHLADPSLPSSGAANRAEDLSRRLSRFYQRNLEQRAEDHAVLKALFESEQGLNTHLMQVFEPTLQRLATLGYPGLTNPRLEIKSALNPATVMHQDASVHYVLGAGESAVRLPDSYNGLGFKNLIYMVVEILDLQERWRAEGEDRPPLHLIFIEEPEAHLHAQLQQVFIRNILTLLKKAGDESATFASQVVITTHSPHILYERGFAPIRYFRRHASAEGEQSTRVLNLSQFQKGDNPKDRDFLQRYLKLTHCDLFFADAAILVEGNVERLLLPTMIEKAAASLRSASLSILEVGGAFGHRFKELIEFIGVTTLVITDIDSVKAAPTPATADDDDDEDKEFEIPAVEEGGAPQKRKGSTCPTNELGAVTANQTLIKWMPRKLTIDELLAVPSDQKSELLAGSSEARARVTYQYSTEVTWNGHTDMVCGRTLEEAFGLENAAWCQNADQRSVGLTLRGAIADPKSLATRLHRRVTGKNFDKTNFALGVLTRKDDDWVVPAYIREGLEWLKQEIDFETALEASVVNEAVATAADAE